MQSSGTTDISGSSSNKVYEATNYKPATERFSGAKGISSDMYFNRDGPSPEEQRRIAENLSRFSGSKGISSDMFFNRDAGNSASSASTSSSSAMSSSNYSYSTTNYSGSGSTAAALPINNGEFKVISDNTFGSSSNTTNTANVNSNGTYAPADNLEDFMQQLGDGASAALSKMKNYFG